MSKFHFFWKSKIGQWNFDKFTDGRRTYNCCEQYMMAQKSILFKDDDSLKEIMNEKNPKEQKALGRKVRGFDPKVWDSKARTIVYNGNYYRFSQNEESKKLLMETEGELVEASPYDEVWGIKLAADHPDAMDKSKWRGKNWLGEVLTRLREDFKNGTARPMSLDEKW